MNLIELGKRIKVLREKSRLTQRQLADSLQISAQAVSKWERGENAPDITMLIPLSKILKVTVEWILSGEERSTETFEATVLSTSLRNYAYRSVKLSAKDIAHWVNSVFYLLTETIQGFGGVTVKYTGDGYLAYFSGTNHAQRAFDATWKACRVIEDKNLLATLHTGQIFLGTIGHPDYSSPDILGDVVNTVFLMNHWATGDSNANLVISDPSWQMIHAPSIATELSEVSIAGQQNPIKLHNIAVPAI